MADDDQENKTEQASPRKREESRKKGIFAHSPDLAGAVALSAGLLSLAAFGPWIVRSQLDLMKSWFAHLDGQRSVAEILNQEFPAAVLPVALAVCSTIAAVMVAGVVINVLQAGLHFNLEWLAPKWDRVDPMEGSKKLFSLNSLVGAGFGVLKLAVVSWAAYHVLIAASASAPMWWQSPASGLLSLCSQLVMKLSWSVATPLFVLAAGDFGYKKYKHEKELMMSREELKEENRQQEGDPHIKQRIRQIQRTRAMKRMMQDVPKATVVITNPTHVAVALRYEPGMAAPIVIAKGEHLVAQRIKAIAASHDIPVIEEPPLARAMLRVVQIGQEIPFDFYRAVAEILALLHRRRFGGANRIATRRYA